jgi:hypothetical protein
MELIMFGIFWRGYERDGSALATWRWNWRSVNAGCRTSTASTWRPVLVDVNKSGFRVIREDISTRTRQMRLRRSGRNCWEANLRSLTVLQLQRRCGDMV